MDGHSAWSKRFVGKHFEGPRIPFGCRLDYLPRPEAVKALPRNEASCTNRGLDRLLLGTRGILERGINGRTFGMVQGI